MGMRVRDGLPRVSYATALDIFLFMCLIYATAALVEYAAVTYFTKRVVLEGGYSDEEEEEEEEEKAAAAAALLEAAAGTGQLVDLDGLGVVEVGRVSLAEHILGVSLNV
jgi:hypothetical protein